MLCPCGHPCLPPTTTPATHNISFLNTSPMPNLVYKKGGGENNTGGRTTSHFCIRFIQFQYVEENGFLSKLSPMPLKKSYGQSFNVVKLAYPDEFLKGISGWWNENVTSLTFTTNRDTYGPFGCKKERDDEFNFQTGDEPLFSGFHGSNDKIGLRTIGIYANPEHASL